MEARRPRNAMGQAPRSSSAPANQGLARTDPSRTKGGKAPAID
ncbi:hypothetical protein AAKU55_001925 [Oxalobacteraceae bacterium GrIS 1.11]